MIIGVDFDGTLVTAKFPEVGTPLYGGKDALSVFKRLGHTIIINTLRTGYALTLAKRFLDDNGYKYDYINENTPELIEEYGDSRKIAADIYIDDRNIGGFPGWEWALKAVIAKTHQKPLIFAIVGESGSGKTEMAKFLEHKYSIPMIDSYTDRPMRTPDEKGHTFISREEFDNIPREDMLALSSHGKHRYGCLHADVSDTCVYVINEHGLTQLFEYEDKYDIISIRIATEIETRETRVDKQRLNRDKGQFVMPYTMFDLVIHNDSDLTTFHYLIDMYIKQFMDERRPYTHFYKGVGFKAHM